MSDEFASKYRLPFAKTRAGYWARGYLWELFRNSDGDISKINSSMSSVYKELRKMAADKEYCLVAMSIENEIQDSFLRIAKEKDYISLLTHVQQKFSILDDPIKKIANPYIDDIAEEVKIHEKNSLNNSGKKSYPLPLQHVVGQQFMSHTLGSIVKPFAKGLADYLAYGGFQQEWFLRVYLSDMGSFRNISQVVERSVGIEAVRRKRRIKQLSKFLKTAQKENIISKEFDIDDYIRKCLTGMEWVKPKDNEFVIAWLGGRWSVQEAKELGVDVDKLFAKILNGVKGRKPSPILVNNHLKLYSSVINDLSPEVRAQMLEVMAWMLSRTVVDADNEAYILAARRVIHEHTCSPTEAIAAHLHAKAQSGDIPDHVKALAKSLGAGITPLLKELSFKVSDELALYGALGILDKSTKRLSSIKRQSVLSDFEL
ncbi:hypothetical protein P5704_023990 (plasmid) [Pseudomonas sp. FeN3W]|nr:hypothetical protein P5704_023990 [Pseudomonas sp. FeN3W]